MEDLLARYGATVKKLSRGDKVFGKVIGISSKKVNIDIGGKSEALVAEKAYSESKDFIKTLKIGDEVAATVIVGETPEGFAIVSLRDAAHDASWKKLEEAKKEDKPVAVIGRNVIQSGITVDVEGLTGYIPNSQLGKEAAKNSSLLLDRHFKAKVIDLDRSANKIVLSEREISDVEDIKEAKVAYEKIKEGEVYEGEVTTIANFGCFVSIPVKVDKNEVKIEGLVHISELSWGKIGDPKDVVEEKEKVKVKIIGKNDGKLALSIKQAKKDPWQDAVKKYTKDSRHKGKAVRLTDFGVFIELEEGIEGLIHITKIPPGKRLEIGDSVNVYVEEIDPETRKLSLGLVLTAKPVGYK